MRGHRGNHLTFFLFSILTFTLKDWIKKYNYNIYTTKITKFFFSSHISSELSIEKKKYTRYVACASYLINLNFGCCQLHINLINSKIIKILDAGTNNYCLNSLLQVLLKHITCFLFIKMSWSSCIFSIHIWCLICRFCSSIFKKYQSKVTIYQQDLENEYRKYIVNGLLNESSGLVG